MVFSNRLIDLVEDEFDTHDIVHLAETVEIQTLDPVMRSAVHLLIVDETEASHLKAYRHIIEQFGEHISIAMAYRTVDVAASVFQELQQAQDDWAFGFLPMNINLEAWVASLRLLILNEGFIPVEVLPDAHATAALSPPCARDTPQPPQERAPQDHPFATDLAKLTNRERQIIQLISQGHRNRAIAKELGLSVHTVKLHVHNIFGKLGVDNRTSATTKFLSYDRP